MLYYMRERSPRGIYMSRTMYLYVSEGDNSAERASIVNFDTFRFANRESFMKSVTFIKVYVIYIYMQLGI